MIKRVTIESEPLAHSEDEAARASGWSELRVYRHGFVVRVTHWLIAFAFFGALLTGLNISQAYPRFHVSDAGNGYSKALFVLPYVFPDFRPLAHTYYRDVSSWDPGQLADRVLTSPFWDHSKQYHVMFAWLLVLTGIVYLLVCIGSGRFGNMLLPKSGEFAPLRLVREARAHALFRFPQGEEARSYNPLQKAAYLSVILVALPLEWLSGIVLVPPMQAAWPWLKAAFLGHQTARLVHLLVAFALVAFVIAHVLMVGLSGFRNNMMSMLTGWYKLPQRR